MGFPLPVAAQAFAGFALVLKLDDVDDSATLSLVCLSEPCQFHVELATADRADGRLSDILRELEHPCGPPAAVEGELVSAVDRLIIPA